MVLQLHKFVKFYGVYVVKILTSMS